MIRKTSRYRASLPDSYSWASQAMQYPGKGEPGLGYFAGEVGGGKPPVDCLLYRDDYGTLIGILNHYPVDYPPFEKAGNVNIWVHPDAKRLGIGSKLVAEAEARWGVDFDQQRYTHEGAAFVEAYLTKKESMTDV